MKQFIDKLISRLEEEKSDWNYDYNVPINRAISVVNQLAEEYKGGWIPCSERLPEIEGCTSDTVLVCTIDGFQHMAFWCGDKKWRYCESGMIKKPMDWTEIVSWMPLPKPYQKEGE